MLDSLACALVKLVSGFLCRMPPGVAIRVGQGLGLLAYWVSGQRAQLGVRNLRAAFDGQLMPAQARRIIRDSYQELGAGFMELLRLPAMDLAYIERHITVEGREHFNHALSSGKAIIFLTGHYGNWEISPIAAALEGHPVVALARAQKKLPKLYQLLVSYRERTGCTVVHKGGGMKQLIAALQQRKIVGIVGDQASRQGLFIEFLGRPALFAAGPLELAYRRDALVLLVFIRRLHGPFHQVMLEPPIVLSRERSKEDAIRDGLEQFAGALARHILDDPSQWLWMHKRWKYTPARRALVLSDGKLGHLKQSLTVVEALRRQHPTLTHHVVEIRYRGRLGRALALAWSWLMPSGFGAVSCLRAALSPDSAEALLSRYADVIVSCGAATMPANVLWSAEQEAKSIALMNPAPLPLSRFHLVIAPQHDGLPKRSNVVETVGAITGPLSDDALIQARCRLQAHPLFRAEPGAGHRHPVVALFLGGETAHYAINPAFAETLLSQVWETCAALDGRYLVTTSRRTSPAVEQLLSHRVERDPRCRLLLVASRDLLDGTMEGMLGFADVAVVTGESISMVSEACASGRPVVVVEPPQRHPSHRATKHQRFLRALAAEGCVQLVPVSEAHTAIHRALTAPSQTNRLDTFAVISEAVKPLI
ncbi:MAG: mitochondrial fission ELM1 family protein [Candidatus Omnitrophica bacterium]|nr:mitochondrial fission ELM1 family protein [Candidatus Omnitrophota bacterium]